MAEVFERLVRRHRSEIYRTVLRQSRNREDAEDLTQITFLNAYAALRRGAEPEAPRAWLHAIARNAASHLFRQRKPVVELDTETALPFDEDAPTLDELRGALARLTFNQRASLLMREVGGLSAAEIGSVLTVSPGAVATLLFRARQALRAELDAGGVRSPGKRTWFGGAALLPVSIMRWAWGHLLSPEFDGAEMFSRSAAVVGAASVAAGAALFTGVLPVPAGADPVRVARSSAATSTVLHAYDIPQRTAARTRVRFAASHVPVVTAATPTAHVRVRTPLLRLRQFDSPGTASVPPAARRAVEMPAPAPALAADGEPAPEQSDDFVHGLAHTAVQPLPVSVAQPLVPADPLVSVQLPAVTPDPSQLPLAALPDLPAVGTLPSATPSDATSVSPPPAPQLPLPANPAT